MGDANHMIGMFMIGIVIGMNLPAFPEPLGFIRAYLPILLLIIAVVLFIKS